LKISGLSNPQYAGNYQIRCLVFGNGATFPNYEFSNTFNIDQSIFSAANLKINPLIKLKGEKTVMIVSFKVKFMKIYIIYKIKVGE
jgi:hypothetical protein